MGTHRSSLKAEGDRLRARHSKPCRQARVVARTGEAWPGKADERVRGHVFSGCPPAAKFLFRGLDTRLIRCWTGIPAIPYQCDCERCDARQSPWSPSIRLTRLPQSISADSAIVWCLVPEWRPRFDAVMVLGCGTVPRIRSWS